jgi:hypothetical protein
MAVQVGTDYFKVFADCCVADWTGFAVEQFLQGENRSVFVVVLH